VRDEKTGQVVTTDPALANLAIVPLLTPGLAVEAVSAQEEPEILGWNTRKDMTPPRLPCTSVLHTRKGKGEQRFLTLLLPLKPDQSSPVRRVGREGADTLVEFEDGRKFLISTEDGLNATELPSIGGGGRKADAR
jgi:hypothetical protein